MVQSPDLRSSHIDLQGASRFLTNFLGLLESNMNKCLINKVIEKLNHVLHQKGFSDGSCVSNFSDNILSYANENSIKQSSSFNENRRAFKLQSQYFCNKNTLKTCCFNNVSLVPCKNERTMSNESLLSNSGTNSRTDALSSFESPQSESSSDYEVTNWGTARNDDTFCHTPAPILCSSSTKRKSVESDYSTSSHFNASSFPARSERENKVPRLHIDNRLTDASFSSKFEPPCNAPLRFHKASLSLGDSHKAPHRSSLPNEFADEKSNSASMNAEIREIPCTPPDMWSLQFS